MFLLNTKTALVTGAGSGIGAAIATAFAQAGAMVWVVDRDATAGERVVAKLIQEGLVAKFASLDVSSEADALGLAGRLPGIDILANNAGIGHVGNLLTTSADDLDRLFGVNVRGPFNLCKAFVPAMLERKQGSVINIASIGGVIAVRDRLAYTATKHAVVGLTRARARSLAYGRALQRDLSRTGRNTFCPGSHRGIP